MVLFIFIVAFVLWYSGEVLIDAIWNSRLARKNAERMIESLPKIREVLRNTKRINRELTETLNNLRSKK